MTSSSQPSYFGSTALDHAVAGVGAGTAAVFCMHPLDLLKVKFQVATAPPAGGIRNQIWLSLKDVWIKGGVRGLYRGVGANVAGNASSWGLYFWFYKKLQERLANADPSFQMTPTNYLVCSAEASAITAILTNPIWVVKVRMFTTSPDSPLAYRGLVHGLGRIYHEEGPRGWWKGTSLALFGVINGALQFTFYEEMKRRAFAFQKARKERNGVPWDQNKGKLPNSWYTVISASAKVFALCSVYPYQVVRSRIQNNATTHLYPNVRTCIRRTWADEGPRGFYRGLGTNLVRVLPGTCVTFVVYENIAHLLRTLAGRRELETGRGSA